MMARWLVLSILVLLPVAILAQEEIAGGREQAKFEPGDVAVFAEDFSSVPIGEIAPTFELHGGSYECARYKGKMWVRPLSEELRLFKSLDFPSEFSLEMTLQRVAKDWTFFSVTLVPAQPQRGLFINLEAPFMTGFSVNLKVSNEPKFWGDIPGSSFRPEVDWDQPIHIALVVRRGQLRVFVNGKRVAVVPFQPKEPVKGVLFHWRDVGKDKFVLLTDVRIATYSQVEPFGGRGGTAQLVLVAEKKRFDEKHPLREALKKLGAVEVSDGWWLPLPAEPFEAGSWQVKIDEQLAKGWAQNIRQILELSGQETRLRVEGFAPEVGEISEGNKERRFLLSALRARVLALWLMQLGISPERIEVKQ